MESSPMEKMISHSDGLFSSNNMKCFDINTPAKINRKSFTHGLADARNILSKLERSLDKSNKYQILLLNCKTCHIHPHNIDDWWDSSDDYDRKSSMAGTEKTMNSCGSDLMESWSAMFIICLEDKYEQLSKRYKDLLKVYGERSEEITRRDLALLKMHHRVKRTYSKLMNAHKILLAVGEKYLTLKRKMNDRKSYYEETILKLQRELNEVIEKAEQARIEFDEQLTRCLSKEQDKETSVLLYGIKRSNQLCLENFRLKNQIQDSIPENISWK